MASRHRFDYDDFLRRYRTACARRGIDPARGANGYQVVHVAAERQRTTRARDCWWQRHEIWLHCPPYRSETEQEALWNVFMESYAVTAAKIAQAVRLRCSQMPLRELHRRQAVMGRK